MKLPEGWTKVELKDVCVKITDGTHKTPKYIRKGIPFISTNNLDPTKEGFDFSHYEKYISEEEHKELTKRCKPEKGDILISKCGTIGRTKLVDVEYKFSIFVGLALLKLDKSKLYGKYLEILLNSDTYFDIMCKLAPGSTRKTLTIGAIEKIPLTLPPLSIQQKIVSILEKAEKAKEMRKEADELTKDFLKSIFLEMFGDPSSNPKKWKMMRFDQVGELARGKSKHRPRNAPELLGGKYPLIQTGEVANSRGYILNYTQTYSDIGLKQSKMWPKGTLCITIAANIALTGILTFDACFPDSIVGFKPNNETRTEYVQYWLSFLQKTLEDCAPESAQKNINIKILSDLKIPVPPISLQNKFASIVKEVEAMKEQQKHSKEQIDKLFNALMQKAFKGELV